MNGTLDRTNAPPKPRESHRALYPLEFSVGQVIEARDAPIWDVRPLDERYGEPGYIPGSRSMPLTLDDVLDVPWESILQEQETLVLCCFSGKRSQALVGKLHAAGYTGVVSLQGGVLEWAAQGRSLCVPHPDEPEEHREIVRMEQLPRAVLACFIAEASRTQMMLGVDPSIGPDEVVSQVFGRPGALSTYERAMDTLDLLGENARRLGHSVDQIGNNLNAMRATVQRLAASPEFRNVSN